MSEPSHSWNEEARLVLSELERHSDLLENLMGQIDEIRRIDIPGIRQEIAKEVGKIKQEDLPNIRVELATLKTKSGLLGLFAGSVPQLLTFLYKLFTP